MSGGGKNEENRFICVSASFAVCDLGGVGRLAVSDDLGIRLANVGEMDAVEMKGEWT